MKQTGMAGLIIGTVFVGFAMTAGAVLQVYEGFAYSGTNLNTQAGGTGWADWWYDGGLDFSHLTDDDINAEDQAVVTLNGFLKLLRRGKTDVPPPAGLGGAQEFRQGFEIMRVGFLRYWNYCVLIQVFISAIVNELARMSDIAKSEDVLAQRSLFE